MTLLITSNTSNVSNATWRFEFASYYNHYVTNVTDGAFFYPYICITKRNNMQWLSNYKLTFLGIALGAIAGYIYYLQIGCASGTCMITSSPVNSTLYGAMMGGLLLNTFQKDKSTETNSSN